MLSFLADATGVVFDSIEMFGQIGIEGYDTSKIVNSLVVGAAIIKEHMDWIWHDASFEVIHVAPTVPL